jgi:RHS repeat-associated protein
LGAAEAKRTGINTTFTYDAKGNMLSGNGLTYTYTASNKPATITRGTASVSFDHDPEHQRYAQTSLSGVTLYIAGGGVLAERFAGTGGTVRWTNYLIVGGRFIGIHVENSDETTLTRYFHTDHLGSIAVITDEAAIVKERLSYDAWGLRRHPDGTPDPSGGGTSGSQTTRGFTGHEHLNEVGLIHMNGRVYDPLLGRFGTPDPMTESPFSTQGWNRYSYVGNSPLNFTDPTGYCFMGCFWKPLFKAIGNFFRQSWRAIVQIGATALLCGPGAPLCAGVVAFAVTGLTSGDLGLALRAGATAFFTAAAMYGVGEMTNHNPAFMSPAHLANMAGHALVGCASSVASGGRCGPGALTGALGSFGAGLMRGQSFAFSLVARSVLGGVASVAGGGQFANGAILGAFSYLFNDCGGGKGHCRQLVRELMELPMAGDLFGGSAASYHYYSTSSAWICGGADPGCSIANVQASMLATQVPGYDGTVAHQGIYPVTLPVLGYVGDVSVFVDGLSVSNVTEPNHVLNFGYITRTMEIKGDSIYISTIGEGANFAGPVVAGTNQFFGSQLFEQQAVMTRSYYNQNFGGK